MSSCNKANQRSIANDLNKPRKAAKFVNGRWTEKEHYLFLIAVKEHGKDWKKIEEIVKTRSSTQARSHSQKVLKDDQMKYIDSEIERLAKIYDETASGNAPSHQVSKPTRNPQLGRGGVKNKRMAKRANKESNVGARKQKAKLSTPSSEDLDEEFADPTAVQEYEEYSEYSYPETSNMKLFTIQRIKRKRVPKRRRKVRTEPIPAQPAKEPENIRKDSVATSASSMTMTTLSPAKTAASVTLTPNIRGRNHNVPMQLSSSNQDGGVVLKENGEREEQRKAEPENRVDHPKINLGLQKAVSLQNTSPDLGTNVNYEPTS